MTTKTGKDLRIELFDQISDDYDDWVLDLKNPLHIKNLRFELAPIGSTAIADLCKQKNGEVFGTLLYLETPLERNWLQMYVYYSDLTQKGIYKSILQLKFDFISGTDKCIIFQSNKKLVEIMALGERL